MPIDPNTNALHDLSLKQLMQGLRDKQFSSVELTQHYINRIKQFDPELNSFISLTEEMALKDAQQADKRLAANSADALTGIPIAHKDIFCTKGVRTSCASKMLDPFIAPYDATMVSQLKAQGSVMLGKTNMDEFAMGSSSETSFYGPVKNPWDHTRVPGGSSGGSAAAVAARLTPLATGTDTGGSIRQPAALTGITGLKPTYGRVSRYGMIAFASSLDQAGPMTRSAEDAAWFLGAMAGFDPRDSTCLDTEVPDYIENLEHPLSGLKIGLPKEYFSDQLDSRVATAIQAALKEFEKMGATLKDISLPHNHLSVPAYYVIAPAECSANLSRMDGVRFGHRCDAPKNLEDLYKRSRAEGFGNEVKRRILVGTYALSAGFYDAYYLQAQKIRRLIKDDFATAFAEVDVIMGPTSPHCAFPLGSKNKDPITMYLEDIFTIATNLAGLPGLSIPAGQIDGLPIGLQIIGNYLAEGKILNVAHQYQQLSDWHQRKPEGY